MYEIFYAFPRKTQKCNSEVLLTQSLVQTGGGGIPTTFQTRNCQSRSIVTVLDHHKRITIMALYEQVQEQEEKKCVKAM